MGIVYQLTFFLALGLLGIVIAIFVFAVSQVGKATESASSEQESILASQKSAKINQIKTFEKELEEAKKSGQLDETNLLQKLQETKDEIKSYDTQLINIKNRIDLIKIKGAVLFPGIPLALTITLAVIASGFYESKIYLSVALSLWIISLFLLAFSIYRIYLTLGAIEQVTINTKEPLNKLPDAVKSALISLEQIKKPVVTLTFQDIKFPIMVKQGEKFNIPYYLKLTKGDAANNVMVFFMAPQGFTFLNGEVALPPSEKPNYVSVYFPLVALVGVVQQHSVVQIQAPKRTGQL